MKFYNREQELAMMEHLFRTSPSFLVITGRRRVGKTELIREFCRSRKFLYYYVDQNKRIDILMEEFSRLTATVMDIPGYIRTDSPEALLEFLFSYEEPVIIVFDEFQRFLKVHPSFIPQLQRFWDTKPHTSRIFLVVSGSSVGMIRSIFQDGESPLFQRADNIFSLRPFGPKECLSVLEDIGVTDPAARLDLYLLFGGTIYYYTFIEKYAVTDLGTALDRLVLNDLAPFRREMSDVLIEEFGKAHATYYEILAAIAEGKGTQKEIADFTHLAATSLPPYLRDLVDLLGLVEYRIPVTEQEHRSKMGRYAFSDNFFRFYARYIYRNMSMYQGGRYAILKERILSEWKGFSGRAFEEMVRTLLSADPALHSYERVGAWWNRRGDEIDLLAMGHAGNLAVEIKDRHLSLPEAREILGVLEKKLPLVKGITGPVRLGLAARTIDGKDMLAAEGYFIRELRDFGI